MPVGRNEHHCQFATVWMLCITAVPAFCSFAMPAIYTFSIHATSFQLFCLVPAGGWHGGFSCADPSWNPVAWKPTRVAEAFGFENSYTSRCATLSSGATGSIDENTTRTFDARAGCFPMTCTNGVLKVRNVEQDATRWL